LFRELEIPAAPLNTPGALFDDPHLNAVGMFETVDTPHGPVRFPGVPTWFSQTPGRVAGPAPELGAHTAEILDELDLEVDVKPMLGSGYGARGLRDESGAYGAAENDSFKGIYR